MQVIEALEKEIEDSVADNSEKPDGRKEWQGANFLLLITFLLLLTLSLFTGSWGLREMQSSDLRLFPQAFITYLFSRVMPLYWSLAALAAFIVVLLVFNLSTFSDINFGYFLGLALAVLVIQKSKWPFWILAPLALHLFGILYMNVLEIAINSKNLTLSEYLLLLSSFSRLSLGYEILLIYPLLFLSAQLKRFVDCFRLLE